MVIFSGIQPTGAKHLGNYIGAIIQYVAGQDRADPAIYCIVDLHAVTVPYEPAELRDRTYDTAAILIAAGLDPERCILFRQADVMEHAELSWLLSSVTPLGELNRMHQFRDKSAAQRELVSAGLLFYPVLHVRRRARLPRPRGPGGGGPARAPGADAPHRGALQQPLRRDARGARGAGSPRSARACVDLQDPERKMSTTGGSEQGTVYVLDEPDVDPPQVQARGRRLGPRDRPPRGQAGDLEPDRDRRGRARCRRRRRSSASSRAPATATSRPPSAEAVVDWLAPVRERYHELRGDEAELERDPRGGRGEGARDRRPDAGRRARGDGRRPRPPGRLACRDP